MLCLKQERYKMTDNKLIKMLAKSTEYNSILKSIVYEQATGGELDDEQIMILKQILKDS